MPEKRTAVLILHYGLISLTIDCIKSVISSEDDKNSLSIFIIDNSEEQDFSLPENISIFEIEILRTGGNLGYAGGMNIGIKEALKRDISFLFLLNNDAVIEKKCISELRDFLEAKNNAGLVSPLILNKENPQKIWATGSKIYPKLGRSRDPYHNHRYRETFQNPVKVEAVTGCSMMVKAGVFKNIGLFDENYFAYYEDIDFCHRAGLFGYEIYFYPFTKVYHLVSRVLKATGQIRKWPDYFMIRNRIYFMKKYSRKSVLLVFFVLVLFEILFNFAKNTLRFKFKTFAAFLFGALDALIGKPSGKEPFSKENISACIITKNAEKTLERCLKSLKGIAEEIIIVDTGSTDNTLAVSRKYTNRFYKASFNRNFSEIRNKAAQYATNAWILALDADEYLSEELRLNIRHLASNQKYWGYYFKRINFYGDKVIRFGYPGVDSLLRLYRKNGSFFYGRVHEKVITQGLAKKTRLKLFHRQDSNNYTFESFRNKWLRYIDIESEEKAKFNKNKRTFYLLFSPIVFVFIMFRDLFILLGIFDGLKGFKIAYFRALYHYRLFLKIFRKIM
ncbi:MAG: glycosyltransferase [Candidatus Aminicenantes bacterium]|nr:glycosyltransferase [Candidatus Aminicenantes bacterium]